MDVMGSHDDVADFHAHAEQDVLLRRVPDVIEVARMLDSKRRRHREANVVKVQEQSIAESLDEASVAFREDVSLDFLDKGEPSTYDVYLFLFDEAHGFDHVNEQHRSVGPSEMGTEMQLLPDVSHRSLADTRCTVGSGN
jgi:hypothetical protein